jgi:O-antigen ligase
MLRSSLRLPSHPAASNRPAAAPAVAVRHLAALFGGLALALAWLIPNHYPPWTSFYNESATAVALALLVAAFVPSGRAPLSPAAAACALLAIVPWLQWLGGLLRYSGDAVVACLYLLGTALAFATGRAAADKPRLAGVLGSAALVAAVVSVALAAIETFGGISLGLWAEYSAPGYRTTGNLAQPNNFATLIGLGALGAVYLHERGALRASVVGLLVAVLVVGSAMTQSRTALLFCPAILAVQAIATRRGVRWRTRPAAVVAVLAAQWVLALIWPLLLRALDAFDSASFSIAERGVGTVRFKVWPILLDALGQAPWTGYGWLQVGAAELAAADRHPVAGEMWLNGHNVLLELLLWNGYPLGILVALALVAWWVRCLVAIRTIESAIGLMVVSVVGIHACVELPHDYAYFLVPVALWWGLAEPSLTAARVHLWRWLAAPAIAASVLLAGIWRDYRAVEDDFRLMRFEHLRIGNLKAAVPAPDAPFLSSLTAYLAASRMPLADRMSPADLQALLDVTARYPYAFSMMRSAVALALNGRPEDARRMMDKLLHIHGEVGYWLAYRELAERHAAGRPAVAALVASLPVPRRPSPTNLPKPEQ